MVYRISKKIQKFPIPAMTWVPFLNQMVSRVWVINDYGMIEKLGLLG